MIEGWEFRKLGDVVPEADATGSIVSYFPQSRFVNTGNLPLHRYGSGPFCKFVMVGVPSDSGVYAYFVEGQLKYVGETHFARQTLYAYRNISPRMCFKGGQERSCRINNLLHNAAVAGKRIELWFMPTPDHKAVEAELRRTLQPEWNKI